MKAVHSNRKILLLVITALLFVFSSLWLHRVYAGKPKVSLNSPVSFPVDI